MATYRPVPVTGAQSSNIVNTEATTSTTYVSLTTPQSVTVIVGSSGMVNLHTFMWLTNNAAGGNTVYNYAAVELSGANTVAANDNLAAVTSLIATGGYASMGLSTVLTGLTPGSTTFTHKFRTSAGNVSLQFRRLSVTPL